MISRHIKAYTAIAVLLLIAAIIAFISARPGNVAQEAPPEQTEAVVPPKSSSEPPPQQPVEAGFIGVILARESVDVSAKFEGRLERVDVRLGDQVSRNARIASLDVESVRQDLTMAQASSRAAEAERRKAAFELEEAQDRYSKRAVLVNSGVVATGELTSAKLQEDMARANLEAAQARTDQEAARVNQLTKMVADAVIRAPFDGTVAARHKDPGAFVSQGAPIISLIRSDDLWVRFAAPESELGVKATGLPVSVVIEPLNLRVTGVIKQIAPEVNAANMVVLEAKLVIPTSMKGAVIPGMTARVSTNAAQKIDVHARHQ